VIRACEGFVSTFKRAAANAAPSRSICHPESRRALASRAAQTATDPNDLKKSSSPLHPNRAYRIKKSESSCAGMFMETLRKKSFWGAMVFVAVFVTSIVVLLADNAMAR